MLTQTDHLSWRTRWAERLSDWASPPVLLVLSLAVMISLTTLPWWQGVVWGTTLALLIAALPLAYIVWLVRRGAVTDIHLPHRHERRKPMCVSVVCSIIALALTVAVPAPVLVQRAVLLGLLQSLLIALITPWWKVSVHGATTGFFTGILLLPGVVGWARVELRRHTVAQVIVGTVIGVAAAWLV